MKVLSSPSWQLLSERLRELMMLILGPCPGGMTLLMEYNLFRLASGSKSKGKVPSVKSTSQHLHRSAVQSGEVPEASA